MAGKIKSWAWGDYIYYTQIFDFVYAVAKKGILDVVVVAVFDITVVVRSFEYLRLSSDSPPKMSYE